MQEDRDFLIDDYQQRFWRLQNKELSRRYKELVATSVVIGVFTGVIVGAIVAIFLTMLMN